MYTIKRAVLKTKMLFFFVPSLNDDGGNENRGVAWVGVYSTAFRFKLSWGVKTCSVVVICFGFSYILNCERGLGGISGSLLPVVVELTVMGMTKETLAMYI